MSPAPSNDNIHQSDYAFIMNYSWMNMSLFNAYLYHIYYFEFMCIYQLDLRLTYGSASQSHNEKGANAAGNVLCHYVRQSNFVIDFHHVVHDNLQEHIKRMYIHIYIV